MKKEGSLKIALSILVIILVTLVSIWGVYVKSGNTMRNKLPDYKYGMELKNTNIINLEVKKEETSDNATEETAENNSEENKEQTAENGEQSAENKEENKEEAKKEENKEEAKKEENKKEDIYNVKNYKKAKEIIGKRFAIVDVNQYTIRVDEKTGNMVVEVPTELSSLVSQNEFAKGKFEVKITDNNEVIADNKNVQDVKTSINRQYANVKGYGSVVELSFTFNKDAIKKFNDIKNNYELTTMNNNETQTTTEGEQADPTAISNKDNIEDRKVGLYLDGTALYTTTLEDFLKYTTSGTLPLSIGGYTDDEKTLENSLKQANITKSLILTENLPFEYTASTTSNIHSNINKKGIIIVFVVIFAVMLVYLVAKGKLQGLLGGLTILGYISILLLIIRFTNVALTISSIFALAVMMILQFVYLINLLKGKLTKKKFGDTTLAFTKMLIPVFLMAIAISFAKIIELIGFGEVMFWGIPVFTIYNGIITKTLLTNVKNK